MTRTALLLPLVAGCAMLLLVTMFATRARAARVRLESAETRLAQVHTDAAQLAALRNRQQTVARAMRPTQEVIAQINRVLTHAGLSERLFKSLTPEATATVRSPGQSEDGELRKQSMRLALQGLEPEALGRFLVTWREEQPLWTVTRIDLVHQRTRGGRNQGENMFDASIVLTAVYVEDA